MERRRRLEALLVSFPDTEMVMVVYPFLTMIYCGLVLIATELGLLAHFQQWLLFCDIINLASEAWIQTTWSLAS